MKTKFALTMLVFSVAVGAGCRQMLLEKAAVTSPPVSAGAATTNDPNAVAWLNFARTINARGNPTPTQPLVDAILYGITSLVSVAAGWYARNHTAKGEVSVALRVPPDATTPSTGTTKPLGQPLS